MDNKKQIILENFFIREEKYKDSMRYAKFEKSKIKRAAHSFEKFGLSYVLYTLSRLKLPGLFADLEGNLFFGREMIWPTSDITANVLSMYGISPHKSEKRLTLWLIRSLGDSEVFYDIGAHLGYYTALSEEVIASGEVHAFEANNKLCKYLNKNFSNSENIHILCSAVADSVGEVDFYDATEVEDSSTSSRFNLAGLNIKPSKISATTIDNYVKMGNKAPTTIKIDVEGGEYDVIVGAIETLKKYKPRIVMEVWGGKMGIEYSDKAVKKLQGLGYEAFLIKGDGSNSLDRVDDPVRSISDTSEGARDNFLFLVR